MPRKKTICFCLKKVSKGNIMHIQDTFYYCGGFTGGIYIFIKIKSEIRIFDLINSVKEKKKYASATC